MALIVGHGGPSTYAGTIANRTHQSGGSIGGDKKPGIVTRGGVWFNISRSAMNRAPQTVQPRSTLFLLTTRHPVQGTNYQISRRPM